MDLQLGNEIDFIEEVNEQTKNAKRSSSEQKAPRQMRFEAEILAIRQQFGSLEDMRHHLNLSRRKLCEVLMVDPSAWSRWTKDGELAPPHVYKTMALLMKQFNKNPEIYNAKINNDNNKDYTKKNIYNHNETVTETLNEIFEQQFMSQIDMLRAEIFQLKKQIEAREVLTFGWKILFILTSVLTIYVLFR